jgi:hypothetical protein
MPRPGSSEFAKNWVVWVFTDVLRREAEHALGDDSTKREL